MINEVFVILCDLVGKFNLINGYVIDNFLFDFICEYFNGFFFLGIFEFVCV